MPERRRRAPKSYPPFNPGDHVCAFYSTHTELAGLVAEFLAEGLERQEQCWYIAAENEGMAVASALRRAGVIVDDPLRSRALKIIDSSVAYTVRDDFSPALTIQVFKGAIKQAREDGFSGFRAAANMAWALSLSAGPERLIAYETLLRSLFLTGRATGLCLYPRERMPLTVRDGALKTHPIVRMNARYERTEAFPERAPVDRLKRNSVAAYLSVCRRSSTFIERVLEK